MGQKITGKKIKGYCLECKKETGIIVDRTILKKKIIKYIGFCRWCNEYMCRIVHNNSKLIKESQ